MNEQLAMKINEQITKEFFSGNLYLAMASYLASEDLPGFSHFFIVQNQEENFHAMKMFNYLLENDHQVKMEAVDAPEQEFTSVLDVFEKAYAHEQWVTENIYHLMDLANQAKDYRTISFLNWFVTEQGEEEKTMKDIVKKLERVGDNFQGLYALDTELGQRVFVPPADGQ